MHLETATGQCGVGPGRRAGQGGRGGGTARRGRERGGQGGARGGTLDLQLGSSRRGVGD